jgi:hypothetical protein
VEFCIIIIIIIMGAASLALGSCQKNDGVLFRLLSC